MNRFILLSFAFLGFGFYELSGGSDFDPEAARLSQIDARQVRDSVRLAELPKVAPRPVSAAAIEKPSVPEPVGEVTRATLDLVSFEAAANPSAEPEPVRVQPAAPAAPEVPAVALEQLAATTQLSLEALEETKTDSSNSIAFAGNSLVASSIDDANGLDIRTVKGTLVNMRSGPGTDYDVVDQLTQSTRVEILTDSGNGWVELRPVEGGATGWIAEFLLSGG